MKIFRALTVVASFLLFITDMKLTHAQDWIMFSRYINPTELSVFTGNPDLGIYMAPSDGSAPPQQVVQGMLGTPKLSRDQSTLLFTAQHIGFPLSFGIYSQSINGSLPRILTPPIGIAANPSFSPDGSFIVYNVTIPAGGGSGDPTPTPTQSIRLSSPLKQAFKDLFVSKNSNQTLNLIRTLPASNPFIAIASTNGEDGFALSHLVPSNQGFLQQWSGPDWHPINPNRIVVSIKNANTLTPNPFIPPFSGAALYVISPDSNSIQLLYQPIQPDLLSGVLFWEENTYPAWSPNGNFIAFVRQFVNPNTLSSTYSINIIRADGSDAPGRQITPTLNGLAMLEGVNHLSWSPDGEWIVFSLSTSVDQFGLANGYDIFKVRTDGTNFIQLTNDQRSVHPEWISNALPNTIQLPSTDPITRQVDMHVTRVYIVRDSGDGSFDDDIEISTPQLGDAIRFVAEVVNNGPDAIPSYQVELYVNGELFNTGTDENGLGAGMSDRWRSSPWVVEEIGPHVFEWRVIVQNDIDLSNNFLTATFQADSPETPTPTLAPLPTATQTPIPPIEIPSPTPTLLSTPTPIATATPTPTPLLEHNDMWVYEFSENTLEEARWNVIPGGFEGEQAGMVYVNTFTDETFSHSTDNRGLEFLTIPGEVAFTYAIAPFESNGAPILIRAMIRAQDPNAVISLIALKGNLSENTSDGSLSLHSPRSSQAFVDHNRRLILLYEPDGDEPITPAIQVANTSPDAPSTVWIDRLELIRLDRNRHYLGELFFAE